MGKLTPVGHGRLLKQIEIHTHMDSFVCLAFIPQKWALGSSAGTLAKGQEVSSEWEVKRWGCEQHKYSLARKSKHITAAAVVQIDVLGCKPSPAHPCSAAGSLCPPRSPGISLAGAPDCRQVLPFPALLQPDLAWVRNEHFCQ